MPPRLCIYAEDTQLLMLREERVETELCMEVAALLHEHPLALGIANYGTPPVSERGSLLKNAQSQVVQSPFYRPQHVLQIPASVRSRL